MRLTERAPITTAKAVPVTTVKITTMERILVVLKHKKSSNRYYRLY